MDRKEENVAKKIPEIKFEIDKSDTNRDWIRTLAKRREKRAKIRRRKKR